jgi:hypothetical protein
MVLSSRELMAKDIIEGLTKHSKSVHGNSSSCKLKLMEAHGNSSSWELKLMEAHAWFSLVHEFP